MMHIESPAMVAQATFGRDGALFAGLLSFVSQLSVVLWTTVVITAIVRYVGTRVYRRAAVRASTARLEHTPVSLTIPSENEDVRDAIAPATVPPRAPRHRRAEPRAAADLPMHAASTTER